MGGTGPGPGQDEAAGHAQVHDQDRTLGEVRDDVFAPPVDRFEHPTLQTGGKFPRRLAKHVRVQDPEMFNPFAGKCGAKAPDDGLDLR